MVTWILTGLIVGGLGDPLPGLDLQDPPPTRNILQQVVPNPTGRNGYEDYVAAAAVLGSPRHRAFLEWESYHYRFRNFRGVTGDLNEEIGPPPPAPAGLTLASTPLQVKREYVRQFGSAIELAKAGNLKPVTDPRKEIDFATLFPEYAGFKNVSKLMVKSAYVSFADGNPGAGTETLLEGLKMAKNVREVGPLIANLVGLAMQAIMLAELERNLALLSVRDAQKVLAIANQLLVQPEPLLQTLEFERRFYMASAAKMEQSLDEIVGDESRLSVEFKKQSPAARKQILEIATARFSNHAEQIKAVIQSGESNWLAYQDPLEDLEFDEDGPLESTSDFVNALIGITAPGFTQTIQSSARARTQLRLLKLHALVIRYRWENERLPNKLSDAVPPGDLIDPFSKAEFAYEPEGHFGYRLYSKGFKGLGQIELKYRRPIGSSEPDDYVPPPRLR